MDAHQRLLRQEPETHEHVVAPDQPRKSKRRTYAAKTFQGREAFAYEPAPGKWAGKATISVSHTRDSAMPVTQCQQAAIQVD